MDDKIFELKKEIREREEENEGFEYEIKDCRRLIRGNIKAIDELKSQIKTLKKGLKIESQNMANPNQPDKYKCEHCEETFRVKYSLKEHYKTCHKFQLSKIKKINVR